MKASDIDELKDFLSNKDMAQIFHIYKDKNIENDTIRVFNIMRSLYLLDLDNIPKSYFNYYKIRQNDTWTLISHKLYGTVELWWLILKLNNIKDPTFEPNIDESIRYISTETVNQILDTMKDK